MMKRDKKNKIYLILLLLIISFFVFFTFSNEQIKSVNYNDEFSWKIYFVVVPDLDLESMFSYGFIYYGGDGLIYSFFEINDSLYNNSLVFDIIGEEIISDEFTISLEEEVVFLEWNEDWKNYSFDSFLSSFEGVDSIYNSIFSYNLDNYPAIVIYEDLSANISELKDWWDQETFIALSSEDISLIAFNYDGYLDGSIKIDGQVFPVTKVDRSNDIIMITFEKGNIMAECEKLKIYKMFSMIGGPKESPVICDLNISFENEEKILNNIFGHIEYIG